MLTNADQWATLAIYSREVSLGNDYLSTVSIVHSINYVWTLRLRNKALIPRVFFFGVTSFGDVRANGS